MSLDNLHIDIGPTTGRIYVGYPVPGGGTWQRKRDVTDLVLQAVARHLLHGDTAEGGAVDITRDGEEWAVLSARPAGEGEPGDCTACGGSGEGDTVSGYPEREPDPCIVCGGTGKRVSDEEIRRLRRIEDDAIADAQVRAMEDPATVAREAERRARWEEGQAAYGDHVFRDQAGYKDPPRLRSPAPEREALEEVKALRVFAEVLTPSVRGWGYGPQERRVNICSHDAHRLMRAENQLRHLRGAPSVGEPRERVRPEDVALAAAWRRADALRGDYVVRLEALHAVNGEGPHYRASVYEPAGRGLGSSGEVWGDDPADTLNRAVDAGTASAARLAAPQGEEARDFAHQMATTPVKCPHCPAVVTAGGPYHDCKQGTATQGEEPGA